MNNRLHDKTILITGASSGIGLATAHAFASKGSRLILAARRESALSILKQELIAKYSIDVFTAKLDVQSYSQVSEFFKSIPEPFQNIDILINNAGLSLGLTDLAEGSLDDWETMIDTNVKGLLYVTKEVIDIMYKRKHGQIINIGSIAGIQPYAKGAVYCGVKAAVHALSRSLREECIEKNIKISEIMPGMVNTEFSTVRFHGNKQKADNVYSGIEPLLAEDIADLIVYTANLPRHVNLAETLILPTAQASPSKIYRHN